MAVFVGYPTELKWTIVDYATIHFDNSRVASFEENLVHNAGAKLTDKMIAFELDKSFYNLNWSNGVANWLSKLVKLVELIVELESNSIAIN